MQASLWNPSPCMVTRIDLYAAGPDGTFVSLNELGEKHWIIKLLISTPCRGRILTRPDRGG